MFNRDDAAWGRLAGQTLQLLDARRRPLFAAELAGEAGGQGFDLRGALFCPSESATPTPSASEGASASPSQPPSASATQPPKSPEWRAAAVASVHAAAWRGLEWPRMMPMERAAAVAATSPHCAAACESAAACMTAATAALERAPEAVRATGAVYLFIASTGNLAMLLNLLEATYTLAPMALHGVVIAALSPTTLSAALAHNAVAAARGAPCAFIFDASTRLAPEERAAAEGRSESSFRDATFQAVAWERVVIMENAIAAGFSVLMFDVDAVLFRDVRLDLAPLMTQPDVIFSACDELSDGGSAHNVGIMLVTPKQAAGFRAWPDACRSPECRSSTSDQGVYQSAPAPLVRRCLAPDIINLNVYSRPPDPLLNAAFHFNGITRSPDKLNAMKHWGLWFLPCSPTEANANIAESWRQCIPASPPTAGAPLSAERALARSLAGSPALAAITCAAAAGISDPPPSALTACWAAAVESAATEAEAPPPPQPTLAPGVPPACRATAATFAARISESLRWWPAGSVTVDSMFLRQERSGEPGEPHAHMRVAIRGGAVFYKRLGSGGYQERPSSMLHLLARAALPAAAGGDLDGPPPPDADLFLGTFDGVPSAPPGAAPLLNTCEDRYRPLAVAVPDMGFSRWSSAGEFGEGLLQWRELAAIIGAEAAATPDAARARAVLFRGGLLNADRQWALPIFQAHPHLFDVGLRESPLPQVEPLQSKTLGLMPLKNYSHYRANLYMAGNGYSSRLKYLLLMGSPVIMLGGTELGDLREFALALVPYRHYVPATLGSLGAVAAWLLENPAIAENIGAAGAAFAGEHLVLARSLSCWYRILLCEYAQRLATSALEQTLGDEYVPVSADFHEAVKVVGFYAKRVEERARARRAASQAAADPPASSADPAAAASK